MSRNYPIRLPDFSRMLLVGCFFLCCESLLFAAVTTGQTKLSSDEQRAISWLPVNTETLIVASGPFVMPEYKKPEEAEVRNYALATKELQEELQALALGPFGLRAGVLLKHLEGENISLVIAGAGNFRPPQDLGEQLYDGATIAMFSDDISDRRESFLKEARNISKVEQIEGREVAVFKEQLENDMWTFWVSFPENNIVIVATNRQYLQEVLKRIRAPQPDRAFPPSLAEWDYLDPSAEFWGMRHYEKKTPTLDQTSPFGGKRSFNFSDEQAIGFAFESSPSKNKRLALTYLTGNKESNWSAEEKVLLNSLDPDTAHTLDIQSRGLAPGVFRSEYDLSHFKALEWLDFLFVAYLGHAVFV